MDYCREFQLARCIAERCRPSRFRRRGSSRSRLPRRWRHHLDLPPAGNRSPSNSRPARWCWRRRPFSEGSRRGPCGQSFSPSSSNGEASRCQQLHRPATGHPKGSGHGRRPAFPIPDTAPSHRLQVRTTRCASCCLWPIGARHDRPGRGWGNLSTGKIAETRLRWRGTVEIHAMLVQNLPNGQYSVKLTN